MKKRDLKAKLPNWIVPRRPEGQVLEGSFTRLEKLQVESHAAALHHANRRDDTIWQYLPYGPFGDQGQYESWVQSVQNLADPLFYAILDKESGQWGGVASYLRVAPEAGSIEVGHINFSQDLQNTRAATQAMFLMMQWAFDAGYRRYEWKCDAANIPSRRAAQRLGFSYEGTFRQAGVVKGRNRDTAWFSVIDGEWPALRAAFERWLSPDNFDVQGQQKKRLSDLTAALRETSDPVLG